MMCRFRETVEAASVPPPLPTDMAADEFGGAVEQRSISLAAARRAQGMIERGNERDEEA